MKKNTILIFSRKGDAVRSVGINRFAVAAVVLFLLSGFAAYFIPPDMLRIKAADQQKKLDYGKQNEALNQRIFSALRVLSGVKEQIGRLDSKKKKVSLLTGIGAGASNSRPTPHSRSMEAYADKDPSVVLEHVCRLDSIISAFFPPGKKAPNPFEYMPVCKPVSPPAPVVRSFGESTDPFTGRKEPHYGMDFTAPVGAPVIATASGVVAGVEYSSLWGRRITIDHGNGIITRYAHLGSVKAVCYRRVKRGEVIGAVGSSGITTGPHVHYEIWQNNKAVDPARYFFPLSANE